MRKSWESHEKVISCTLRSWFHEICIRSRTVSPLLEDNYPSKCSFNSFPYTKYMSPCLENCQNYIAMYCCPLIAGRRSWKVAKLGTNLYHSCPSILDLFTRLENNDTLQYSSDKFPCMVTYILCMENCQNCILMHICLPITGRLS